MKTKKTYIRKLKNRKSKISYLTIQMVKAELKRKIKFIYKRRRHTENVFQKVLNFFIQKIFYF